MARLTEILVLVYAATILFMAVVAANPFVDMDGHSHSKRHRKIDEPKVLVDTLRMSDGFAIAGLKDYFDGRRKKMAPRTEFSIYSVASGILIDTSDAVKYYGCFWSHEEKQLYVKSSAADDSGLVVVYSLIK